MARVTNSLGVSQTDTITLAIGNPNQPAAPTALSATVSGSNVVLTWTDNASNEQGFLVERKKGGAAWSAVSSLPVPAASGAGATVTYTDSPGKGNWQYRVSAVHAVYGNSAPSNIVSAHVN